jgi:hypothetical protein
MKEGEGEGEVVAVTLSSSSSSSRSYLSPVVRQDLAKLEKGGESRRIAMTMLKQFVEHLDPGSVPRFLAQGGLNQFQLVQLFACKHSLSQRNGSMHLQN